MENKENLLSKEQTTKQNRVWVRIASACNNKCLFCLDSKAQDGTFPKKDEVKKEIREGFKI
jgi:AhpD family alkylhydroperoxidase